MPRYNIEMTYYVGVNFENIEADSREEAIKIAMKKADKEVDFICGKNIEVGNLQHESTTYVEQLN